MASEQRYRVTPRKGLWPSPHPAYGYVWPECGRTVTAAEVGADTLQRLDADPRFTVERLPAETRASPARRHRKR